MKMYGIFLVFFLSVVSLCAMKKSKLQFEEPVQFLSIEKRMEQLRQELIIIAASHELNLQSKSDVVHEIHKELSWFRCILETNKVKARIQKDMDRLTDIPDALQSQK